MKIEHILTFLEIADTGSFVRAAANLDVTQSTISARVKTMEEGFGRPLFTRSHAGVELTDAGIRLRRYALGMRQLWQQANQAITLPEGFESVFGLGLQVSLWERLILSWLPWMREQAPTVAIRVEADYSPSLMRQVADGLLDVAVMYQPRQTVGLIIEALLEETLVLVASEPRDVSNDWIDDYVFVDWGDVFRAQHSEYFPAAAATPAVSVGLGALGLSYILHSGGSGYFPLRIVQPYIDQQRLYRVSGAPTTQRPAYVVYAAQPKDKETLDLALTGLQWIAANE